MIREPKKVGWLPKTPQEERRFLRGLSSLSAEDLEDLVYNWPGEEKLDELLLKVMTYIVSSDKCDPYTISWAQFRLDDVYIRRRADEYEEAEALGRTLDTPELTKKFLEPDEGPSSVRKQAFAELLVLRSDAKQEDVDYAQIVLARLHEERLKLVETTTLAKMTTGELSRALQRVLLSDQLGDEERDFDPRERLRFAQLLAKVLGDRDDCNARDRELVDAVKRSKFQSNA